MYNVHRSRKGSPATATSASGSASRRLVQPERRAGRLPPAVATTATASPTSRAFSVIQRYKELHAKQDFDVSFLEGIIDPEFLTPAWTSGGRHEDTSRSTRERNAEKGFYQSR